MKPAVREGDEAAKANPDGLAFTESISSRTQGSMITVSGVLKHDERVKLGGLEVKVSSLSVESLALPELPIADVPNVDYGMDWRFVDLRRPQARLLF